MRSWQAFLTAFFLFFIFEVLFSGTEDLQQSVSVSNYDAGCAGVVTSADRKTVAALLLVLRSLLNYVNYI
jgi:hypothetical protein